MQRNCSNAPARAGAQLPDRQPYWEAHDDHEAELGRRPRRYPARRAARPGHVRLTRRRHRAHPRTRPVGVVRDGHLPAARRYLTDDTLADLARAMVIAVADETPGADVIQSPRTAAVPLPVLGRCIAGLAEAIQIRLRERDDIDHLRTTVAQLAQALSAIGQVTSDHTPDPAGRAAAVVILMPPGLVNRAARYLEAAAILVHQGVLPEDFSTTHAGQLAATFMQDAASLRYYADERPDE